MYFREPGAVKMMKLGVEALMALFGIFGNICVCLVTTQQVQMKTTMNLYIRNLAIADLGSADGEFSFGDSEARA